jgi:hypothetical protein
LSVVVCACEAFGANNVTAATTAIDRAAPSGERDSF